MQIEYEINDGLNRAAAYLFLLVGLLVNASSTSSKSERSAVGDKFVVCYVRSWAIYRTSYPFTVDKIDPSLCTHLVYMFADISDTADNIVSKIKHIDLPENNGNDMYKKMTSLKNENSNLKILLCVGGSATPNEKYSRLTRSDTKRKMFASNAISFLRKYGFDGLDLYWYNPKSEEDKGNFPILLQELRKDFLTNNLLLTTVVSGSKANIDKGYDVQKIAKYVDWMNVNVYNYHTANDGRFGIHAPMESDDGNNIISSLDYILDKGVPSNKTILRFGVHGYGYTGVDSADNAAGAITGLYDEDNGFLTIFEVCELLDSGWVSEWDDKSSTPIAHIGNKRISFDNPKSLKIKASLAVKKDILGIGISSLDVDDFQGICKLPGSGNEDHKYPLLKALRSGLNNNYNSMFQWQTDNNHDSRGSGNKNYSTNINVSVVIHEF